MQVQEEHWKLAQEGSDVEQTMFYSLFLKWVVASQKCFDWIAAL